MKIQNRKMKIGQTLIGIILGVILFSFLNLLANDFDSLIENEFLTTTVLIFIILVPIIAFIALRKKLNYILKIMFLTYIIMIIMTIVYVFLFFHP